MRLLDRQRKLAREGKIRIGERVPLKNDATRFRPGKLQFFRLTTSNKAMLEEAQRVYGGEITPFVPKPGVNEWKLDTTVTELRCMISAEASVDQQYEVWDMKKGGYVRQCDGLECESVTFYMAKVDGKDVEKARREMVPCLCDPDNRTCDTKTRLKVMLTEIPATGLWQLDSKGEIFADELATTMDLWEDLGLGAGGRQPIFCVLSMHQIQVNKPGEERKDFVVPRLSLDPAPKNFAQLIVDRQAKALAAPVLQEGPALEQNAATQPAPSLPSSASIPDDQVTDPKVMSSRMKLDESEWTHVKDAIRDKITLREFVVAAWEAGVRDFKTMAPFLAERIK